jgi:DNA-3-methyladenine glycosylase
MTVPSVLGEPSLVVAPALLGATISGRGITLRITEVEAYMGDADPGSHAFRGVRTRNAHLFGPPGTLYAYRSYGIHTCLNVVSGAAGVPSGSLLRAGEVVNGLDVARERRGQAVADRSLARGPGNLGQALGAVLADDGSSLLDGSGPYVLSLDPGLEARLASASPDAVLQELRSERRPDGSPRISSGPRTGIRGIAGGATFPWRFWLTGDPSVSAYRRHPQALD